MGDENLRRKRDLGTAELGAVNDVPFADTDNELLSGIARLPATISWQPTVEGICRLLRPAQQIDQVSGLWDW